jgi:hypothetical protein
VEGKRVVQDDGERQYHDIGAYVYVGNFALEIAAIWRGIDRLEQQGISLDRIARKLNEDWPTAVLALARIGSAL